MSYQQSGQYDSNQPYHPQYPGEHVSATADGYHPGYGATPPRQSMNGTVYGNPPAPPPEGLADSVHSPRTASFPAYGSSQQMYAQADSRAPTMYNPQQYVQPVSQYNPQAYGAVNRSYSTSQQTYNPAAYAPDAYQQSSQQYAYPPSAQSSTSYAAPPPPSSGYQQRQTSSYQGVQSSYMQYSNHGPQYASPSEISPQQFYSTYSQPAPQMASSYAAPAPVSSSSSDQWRSPEDRRSSMRYASASYALPGLPDEPSLPSPPTQMDFSQSHSAYDYRDERQSPSPLYSPSPAAPPPPPAHAPQRTNTLGRHPHSRPLPGPPEPDDEPDYFRRHDASRRGPDDDDEQRAQDALYSQVEAAVMNAGTRNLAQRESSPTEDELKRFDSTHSPKPLFSRQRPTARQHSTLNGRPSPSHSVSRPGPGVEVDDDASDDDDAVAIAGLEAMRMADEQDAADEARRVSGGSDFFGAFKTQSQSRVRQYPDEDGEEEYPDVDISNFVSGPAHSDRTSRLSVGGESSNLALQSQPPSSSGSQRKSQVSSYRNSSYDYEMDNIHPFPEFSSPARVEDPTGGLSEPKLARRQSYDEGDEFSFTEDNLVEPFYYPPVSAHRPLPPPPSSSSQDTLPSLDTVWQGSSRASAPPYPSDPEGYQATPGTGPLAGRSISVFTNSSTPVVNQVIRAKTDAEKQRLKLQSYRSSVYSSMDNTPMTGSGTGAVPMDLPSLPTRRFNPAKLGNADFGKCKEPWALSAILSWLRQVADPEQMTEMKEAMIKETLVALFTNKVPTMNITDAEMLSNGVVEAMYAAGTLVATEEWVKLCPGTMTGVLFQLTRSGCYSPILHDDPLIPGRCYSHHCQRTLKKVNLLALPHRAVEDWVTFYKVKKEDVEKIDRKEMERQMVMHEIVQTEDGYMEQLNVLRDLYRDPLANANPSVISPKRLKSFLKDVFGKLDGIKKANEEHLLPQLKYRQQEQGPWITGFSDIFRQWIRKAKTAYIDYAGGFPGASLLMRQELERNLDFRSFVERARKKEGSAKLGWDTYLKAPITRLQRYTLLLSTVHGKMKQETEEKSNLQLAVDEIKAVTMECDARVAEMQRKVDLADLSQKLILRPGMQQDVELNLNHLGRELIYRGDLQRTGANRFNWVECHALLFDHYFILAKAVSITQKGTGGKVEKYDVSRLPIPMDLLVLESISDDAVVKSSYPRGITSVSSVPRASGTPDPSQLTRTQTSQSMASNGLVRGNTSTSMVSLHTVNSNSGTMTSAVTMTEASKDSDKIMYPYRIKHLGREPYVLFAPTAANRADWGKHIVDAKTKHAASLFAQNAEPFRLRVIADSAFYYDHLGGAGGGKSITIRGTPMDRAIKEVEHKFRDTGRPGPICRAKVNCATSFTTPYPGKHMVAVGTDNAVYVSEMDNPRGWSKTINIPKVTQVAVLEEFNLFLLIANGALLAYHLDVVCPSERAVGTSTTNDTGSARKAPQKLSGSRDVGFFAVGRMKERTLIFYKKREGLSSTFKVLEPIFQKSTEKKRGVFKRGTTEFFREYDDFYIPTDCSGINLFASSLAVSTSKGFEVLTLDKKQPWSVPDVKAPEVGAIATHIANQETLGMLRLSEHEFLLCYASCAVYVNKHGDVSRSVIMNFVGKARAAALYGAYLVLFDNDFVEIRNAQNGRLKQIIAGKDVKCLDDGGGGTLSGGSINNGVVNGVPALGAGGRTVKLVMQHPELERIQIVVELVLNERLKE